MHPSYTVEFATGSSGLRMGSRYEGRPHLFALRTIHTLGCSHPWNIHSGRHLDHRRSLPCRTRFPSARLRYAQIFGSYSGNTHTAVDLYGKGYSEAPHTTYDANLFVTQLALLLQYVRWDAAHIVGFSMVSTSKLLNG